MRRRRAYRRRRHRLPGVRSPGREDHRAGPVADGSAGQGCPGEPAVTTGADVSVSREPQGPLRHRAVALRPRSAAAVALVSLAGIGAFAWPLCADTGSTIAHGTDAPLVF